MEIQCVCTYMGTYIYKKSLMTYARMYVYQRVHVNGHRDIHMQRERENHGPVLIHMHIQVRIRVRIHV